MRKLKKSLLSAVLFLLICLSLSMSTQAATVRRALLIGQKTSVRGDVSQWGVPDCNAMNRMLSKVGYSKITQKTNVKGTSLRSFINTAFAGADSDDISLFFFSGHGCVGNGALCMYDRNDVLPSQLAAMLKQIPGTVIVMSNSCFSGHFINKGEGSSDEAAQNFVNAFAQQNETVKSGEFATSKFKVLVAASKYQESWNAISPNQFGFFTYLMIKGSGFDYFSGSKSSSAPADKNRNNKLTVDELSSYINSSLRSGFTVRNVRWKPPKTETVVGYPTGTSYAIIDRNPAATPITLNQTALTLAKGKTAQLKVSGTSSSVRWSSNKTYVATVSSSGLVTAKGAGTAYISATVAGKTLTCKVTVVNTGVKLNRTTATLYAGMSYTLKPSGGSGTIKWTSSNTGVVSVSSSGKLYAKKAGTATVKVTRGSSSATCKVTVLANTHSFYPRLSAYDYYDDRFGFKEYEMYYSNYSTIKAQLLWVNTTDSYITNTYNTTVSIYDKNGDLVAKKSFGTVPLNLAPYSTRIITYTFDSSSISKRGHFDSGTYCKVSASW